MLILVRMWLASVRFAFSSFVSFVSFVVGYVRAAHFGQGRPPLALGALLLALAASGCSKVGTVSGKVTYKGEAVPGGFVNFVPESGAQEGTVFSSAIDANGYYTATGVPVGPVKVLVQNPGGAPLKSAQGVKPAPRKQYPTRYATPESSDLTLTVGGGSQTYDIDLK